MFTEEILKKLEKDDLPTKIARVEALLARQEAPGALELGILLSLRMGQEMQEGKALGSDTASLVVGWMEKYPHALVEEAIAHARRLLLEHTEVVEQVRSALVESEVDPDAEDEAP